MQFIGEREEGINIGRSKVREYSIRMQVPREGEWLEGEEGEEACGGKEESEHGNEVLHAFVAVLPSVACLPSFSCAACVRALQTSLNTHTLHPPPPNTQPTTAFSNPSNQQATVRRRSNRLLCFLDSFYLKFVHIDQNQRHMQLDKGREREKLVLPKSQSTPPQGSCVVVVLSLCLQHSSSEDSGLEASSSP